MLGGLVGDMLGQLIFIFFLVALACVALPPLFSGLSKTPIFGHNILINTTKDPGNILSRLFLFDRYIGPELVKIVYYYGLTAIIVGALAIAFVIIPRVDETHSVLLLLTVIIQGILLTGMSVVGWRFSCERFLLQFQLYSRLEEVRDRLLATPVTATHPAGIPAAPATNCARCAVALAPDARFCTECGTPVDVAVRG